MKKYLKMVDVFSGVVAAKHMDNECIEEVVGGEDCGNCWTIKDDQHWIAVTKEHAEYAAHAINSHDELVAEVGRLRRQLESVFMAGWEEGRAGMDRESAEIAAVDVAAQFARNGGEK